MSEVKKSIKAILPESVIDQYRGSLKYYNSRKNIIRNQLRQMRYAGSKVICPFCEKSFSKLFELFT